MFTINFKNRKRYIKVEILLVCFLVIIGATISSRAFTGLSQTYAISDPSTANHSVLQANKNATATVTAHTASNTVSLLVHGYCSYIPLCGIYDMISNGLRSNLYINTLDNQGKMNGTLNGQVISGSWDPILKKITFTQRIATGSNNSVIYDYTAFFHNLCGIVSGRITVPSGSDTARTYSCIILSGSAIPKGLTSDSAEKQEFGWIALNEIYS